MVRFRTGMWLGPLLALAIVGACGGESDSDDPSDSIGGEGGEGGDGSASGSGGTLIQGGASDGGSGVDVSGGGGFAFDFSNALGRKGVLDARAVYGVRFQIKGTGRIRLAVPTTQTASIGAGGSCVPNASAGCDFHATTPLTLNANWTSVAVLFASLTPGGASVFDPAAILGMAFEAWGVPGSLPVTDFDFCVDDVELF